MLALCLFHAVVWGICSVSLRQQLGPDHLMGRVGGAARVLGLSGLALGAALGGVLGAITLTVPIVVGAAVLAACCLVAALTLGSEAEIAR